MASGTRLKLSTMMFLQYFVWGIWWVSLGTYLNSSGFDDIIGVTYATQGYAAVLTPLFVGLVADRFFAAERVLGVLHLTNAALLLWLSTIQGSGTLIFFGVLLCMMCYIPTLALSSTVAFHNLSDPAKHFPTVRVLGTIGWIAGGLTVGFLQAEQTNLPIRIAAAASLLYGIFAFTLPSTPPKGRGSPINLSGLFGLDVLKRIGDGPFWIFLFSVLLIHIPLSFYYAYGNTFLVELGVERAAAIQTLGQASEIAFMLLLPFFLLRFGMKWVLAIGMAAWAVRYILFAFGIEGGSPIMIMLLAGILLHGICYDFLFVAGQIYVDQKADEATRARAQAFFSLMTAGVGAIIGSNFANWIYTSNTLSAELHDWQKIWLVPAGIAFVVAVGFVLTFKAARDAHAAIR